MTDHEKTALSILNSEAEMVSWWDGDDRENVVQAIAKAIEEAVAAEREACAKVAETFPDTAGLAHSRSWYEIAAAIRARKG